MSKLFKTDPELDAFKMNYLRECKENKNNMSFWLDALTGSCLTIPETTILQLDFPIILPSWQDEKKREKLQRASIQNPEVPVMEWLLCDRYYDEDIEAFTKLALSKLACEPSLRAWVEGREQGTKFLKTGNFSNKFSFNNCCRLEDPQKIGKQFLDIMYAGLCVGCMPSPELVIREFIETTYTRPEIYDGMKLNTEYRAFYDFDNNRALDIFNYWDRDTMERGLYCRGDLETFDSVTSEIEADFREHKYLVTEELKKLKGINLQGTWSVDFLWSGEKMYLIDMALAENSYYFNRVR